MVRCERRLSFPQSVSTGGLAKSSQSVRPSCNVKERLGTISDMNLQHLPISLHFSFVYM